MLETFIEQLRSQLLQVHLLSQQESAVQDINSLTSGIINLLDNMQIAIDLDARQYKLELEPINLLALAEDTAHELYSSASMHGIELKVSTNRRQPVLANFDYLKRAYESMVSSIIDLSKNAEQTTITLRADEQDGATRLGAYSSVIDFSAEDFRSLKKLFGRTARPMARVSTTPVAQLYVADRLRNSRGARLRTSIAQRERGIATVLPVSRQLLLVA